MVYILLAIPGFKLGLPTPNNQNVTNDALDRSAAMTGFRDEVNDPYPPTSWQTDLGMLVVLFTPIQPFFKCGQS